MEEQALSTQMIATQHLLGALLKIRLVPFDAISDRLYKITRNTSRELGKKVALEIQGEKTELDRLLLDRLVVPIEHLLRNALAHGVEEAAIRQKSGKPPAGKIQVAVNIDGNFVIIAMSDDGGGIQTEKIQSIALKKGLLKGIEPAAQTKDF